MCSTHADTQVSRTGRSLWARNGTPAGAPGATGSVARDPRAAGGAEAELLPLDRWLCRGELPGPAAASGFSPALSSDAASAAAAKDQVAPDSGRCPDLSVSPHRLFFPSVLLHVRCKPQMIASSLAL